VLAQNVGSVPTLHVVLETEGTREALEFLVVHQRRYCAEEQPTDAISQHLTESLLRVALEFIFHPSRRRYAKERLMLRECSFIAEALAQREELLPRAFEKVRLMNPKIRHVDIEFATAPRLLGAARKREHSFLVLDEDALKVAPVKSSLSSKAPTAKGAFSGIGKGFLNTRSAKRKGLSSKAAVAEIAELKAEVNAEAPGSVAALPADGEMKQSEATSVVDHIPPSERTRINPLPESRGPPPICTDAEEKRRLLLPAAQLHEGPSPEVRQFAERAAAASSGSSTAGNSAAVQAEPALITGTQEEEPVDDPQGLTSLSELAEFLFGDLAREGNAEDAAEDDLQSTGSTKTPSPKAGSSRDGGTAGSEYSESVHAEPAVTAADTSAQAPQAGLRLLQQRRRDRAAASDAVQAQQPAVGCSQEPPQDESDELVKLWMKQRW